MNIQKYLDGATNTENGTVYKREDYTKAKSNEIVYIDEFSLGQLQIMRNQGRDLTDKEIIKKDLGESRNSIREVIHGNWPYATDEWIDKHNLIDCIIQECTWESAATMAAQMDEWDEIWDDYPDNEK